MMPSSAAATFMAKAERALRAARVLYDEANTEGSCNRAYYAMFYAAHVALSAATGKWVEFKTHRGLVTEFGKRVVLDGHMPADFGRSLNDIQRLRELADYLGDPPKHEDALSALEAAQAFVAAVGDLVEGNPRTP